MTLVFSEDIDYIKVQEEGFVLHLDTGSVESLNPVGTLIFDLLARGVEASALTKAVEEEFDATDPQGIREDVTAFLQDMEQRRILRRKGTDHAEA